jgi:acetyl esterase/lipase
MAPLALVVHAGSWQSGDRRELSGFNRYLASRGIAVAALDYGLAPEHRFPRPVDDIARAMDFLTAIAADYGFRADHLVLVGRSAGGHLALSAAYRPDLSRKVSGVVGLYAPTDLSWSWRHPAPRRYMDSNRVIRDFLGGSFEDVPDVFEAASPLLQVSATCPSTVLVHGGKDELVSPLQSARLADALSRHRVPHLHVELGWGNHAMEANIAGPSGQITMYLVERFIHAVGDY